jgi:hypothetical protein
MIGLACGIERSSTSMLRVAQLSRNDEECDL